ncbi:hypothetical protein [Burkholderia multivorans]|uniref:hypothetical protein n=1 Tax=Burkholderia multivorans TaxID=87883 RepID=UPI00190336A6|nr:hypothetical protein [Burkholderia multivorans]MBJ9624616.1 hypothetical protein [Burkholderia multivorans]
MELCVQFENDSMESIISYFGSPQDESVYQNAGLVLASDSRWNKFYEALPEQAKRGVPVPESGGAASGY